MGVAYGIPYSKQPFPFRVATFLFKETEENRMKRIMKKTTQNDNKKALQLISTQKDYVNEKQLIFMIETGILTNIPDIIRTYFSISHKPISEYLLTTSLLE